MRVGFVGLGAMGLSMARNLRRADLLTSVWNRTGEKARALAAELGIQAPARLADLGAGVDAVVSCVSADADVLEVVSALAPTLAAGSLDARSNWCSRMARRSHRKRRVSRAR